MPLKLYLVRHPESEANVKGINDSLVGSLTPRGYWQLQRTVARLSSERIDAVLSSPAQRCLLLATAIGRSHGVEVVIDNELRERDYGELEGCDASDLDCLGIDGRPKGGESVSDVYERAANAIRRLPHGSVAIVSHGLFLKVLLSQVLRMDVETALARVKFSNGAISLLDPVAPIIEYLNDRTHLGMRIRRIHIFGGWAAGKTTLADRLGRSLGVPVFHLDELKYPSGSRVPEPVELRIRELDAITGENEWITEGAWTDYAEAAFQRAELIIYCEVGYFSALGRAIGRELSRKRSKGHSLSKLLASITSYYWRNGKVSRAMHREYCHRFSNKLVRAGSACDGVALPEELWLLRTNAL